MSVLDATLNNCPGDECKQSHLDEQTSSRSAPVDVESLGFNFGAFFEKDVTVQCHALAMPTPIVQSVPKHDLLHGDSESTHSVRPIIRRRMHDCILPTCQNYTPPSSFSSYKNSRPPRRQQRGMHTKES